MLLLSLSRQYYFFLFFLFFLLLALQPSESLAAQKYFQIWQSGDKDQAAKLSHSGKVTVTPGYPDQPVETQSTDELYGDELATGQISGFTAESSSSEEASQSLWSSGSEASPGNGEEEEKKDVIVEYDNAGVAPNGISITHLGDQDVSMPETQVLITYGSTEIYAFLLDDWLATQPPSWQIINQLQAGTPFWVNMPPTVLPDPVGSVTPVFQVNENGVQISASGQITVVAELLNCHNCNCTECSHENGSHEYNCLNCDCCSTHSAAASTNACKAKKPRVIIKLSADNTQVTSVSLQTDTHLTHIALSDTPFDQSQSLSANIAMMTAFIATLGVSSIKSKSK